MNRIQRTLITMALMLTVVVSGCSSDNETGEEHDSNRPTASQVEHDRDGGESGQASEESGAELGLNEIYDKVRNGARLIPAYDAQSHSFNGTVENTMDRVLQEVRVEVHLSNGKELGPTTPTDLAPGEKRDVKLNATSQDFTIKSVRATDQTQVWVLGPSGRVLEYNVNADPQARWSQEADGLHLSIMRAQRITNNTRWPNPIVVKITNVTRALVVTP